MKPIMKWLRSAKSHNGAVRDGFVAHGEIIRAGPDGQVEEGADPALEESEVETSQREEQHETKDWRLQEVLDAERAEREHKIHAYVLHFIDLIEPAWRGPDDRFFRFAVFEDAPKWALALSAIGAGGLAAVLLTDIAPMTAVVGVALLSVVVVFAFLSSTAVAFRELKRHAAPELSRQIFEIVTEKIDRGLDSKKKDEIAHLRIGGNNQGEIESKCFLTVCLIWQILLRIRCEAPGAYELYITQIKPARQRARRLGWWQLRGFMLSGVVVFAARWGEGVGELLNGAGVQTLLAAVSQDALCAVSFGLSSVAVSVAYLLILRINGDFAKKVEDLFEDVLDLKEESPNSLQARIMAMDPSDALSERYQKLLEDYERMSTSRR